MERQKQVISLVIKTNKETRKIPIEEIFKEYGISFPNSVCLEMEHEGMKLLAETSVDEADYPGIDIDAKDKNGKDIYLANVEFPNETFPDAIAARLYAGYADFETDSPIALTKTVLREKDEVDRLDDVTATLNGMRKYVHVDYDAAVARNWKSNDNLEEHVEEL